MQLNYTGKNLQISDALKTRIAARFNNLEKYYRGINKVHVILRIEHAKKIAEANLHIPHKDINAIVEDDDMYHAIDTLVSKLAVQLAKHKSRQQDNRHHDKTPSYDTE